MPKTLPMTKDSKTNRLNSLNFKLKRNTKISESLLIGTEVFYKYIHGEWNGEEVLSDMHSLDVQFSLNIKENYSLNIGVQNITDNKDIEHLRQIPGRTFYITNNFNF